MQEDLEPLPADLWFGRIEAIAEGWRGSTESGLRHAFHLLQLTPRNCRPPEYWTLDEEAFERLLQSDDLEAAANTLVAAPTLSVTTAFGRDGIDVALRCQALNITVIGKGNSRAAAILQAWAKSFLSLRAEFGINGLKEAIEA